MATDAQIRASVAHNKKMGSITIRPPKEVDDQIRRAAKEADEKLSEYILKAVQERMEKTRGGVVKNPESEPLTTEEPGCSVSPQLTEAIKKCAHDAIYNLSDEEIDKLRSNLEKLIFDSFTVERFRKDGGLYFKSLL